jgi:hypothetical protein
VNLPDEPRWVEAHGIAADPGGWVRPCGAGLAIGHDGARLIVLTARTPSHDARHLAASHPGHALLFDLALAGDVARPHGRAILHGLHGELPAADGAGPLPPDADLSHVPAALAGELAAARTTIWAVWLDGLPSAFAYASWRSPRWFDVAVETLPSARQLGLATIAAAAMIRAERALGREPVWGADEGNRASRRLAARLGFVEIDAIGIAPAL